MKRIIKIIYTIQIIGISVFLLFLAKNKFDNDFLYADMRAEIEYEGEPNQDQIYDTIAQWAREEQVSVSIYYYTDENQMVVCTVNKERNKYKKRGWCKGFDRGKRDVILKEWEDAKEEEISNYFYIGTDDTSVTASFIQRMKEFGTVHIQDAQNGRYGDGRYLMIWLLYNLFIFLSTGIYYYTERETLRLWRVYGYSLSGAIWHSMKSIWGWMMAESAVALLVVEGLLLRHRLWPTAARDIFRDLMKNGLFLVLVGILAFYTFVNFKGEVRRTVIQFFSIFHRGGKKGERND